jgi:beta-glucosidase
MKSRISYLSATFILLIMACNTPTKTGVSTPPSTTSTPSKISLPQLGKSPIKDVIKAMTLEEKANLCIGMGFSFPGAPPGMLPPIAEEDAKTPEKVAGAAGRTHAIPRLGIPSITVSDGPAGVRIQPIRNNDPSKTYYATAFPIGTALASTWDTALVHNLGVAFGNEVREYGIDVLLAPAMNIHRNSLGGRNFEYYSEDPLVSGRMAAAIVNGVQSNGVGTSIKHFAGNNNEFNRMRMNVQVSERALREIYLKNFQIAVQNSNPWTIMSSYNLINGTYTSQSRALLDTVLRKEWGFKGLVMTDWFGGKDAVEQMKAGNDLLMPGTLPQKTAIVEGVKNSALSTKQLDENVERILNLILKTPTFSGYKYSDAPDLKAHAELARKAASESMILLKNTDVLPFKSVKKVAVFGNGSYDLIAGGTGSGDVNKAYMVSLNDGLTNAKYEVDERLMGLYKTYKIEEKAKQPKPKTPFDPRVAIPEMPIGADLVVNTVALNDIAVITIGKNSGEFADRNLDVDFNLSEGEKTLIDDVSVAFHAKKKKVIVVLNVGGVVETASWRDKVDGIVLAWQGGQETGNAIVDVLSGAVNPSGKLPTTFPIDYKDEASTANFPGTELPSNDAKPGGLIDSKPAEITYEEDIYVGYRYFNTYNVKTAYSFGYGMSYTEFSYSDLKLSKPTFDGKITATIKVTNSGKTAGKEVAQLYLRTPDKKMNKPDSELKGFAKTKLLQPNQSETLTFTLNAADLASFNAQSSSWIAEAGKYIVKIGSSATTIKEEASFTLAKELEVEKVNRVLKPQKAIKQMRAKLP